MSFRCRLHRFSLSAFAQPSRVHALRTFALALVILLAGYSFASVRAADDEPPALNPFGGQNERDDATPGVVELSDGRVVIGKVYLTRDARLKVYDDQLQRQREVPLAALARIDCVVKKEWLEKEWRFKENANDEKVFTGKSYPARECLHKLTLHDGRSITGPLAAIVYIQPTAAASPAAKGKPDGPAKPERFLLNKRQKGETGETLKSLVYVKSIALGDEAVAAAKLKQQQAAESAERSGKSRT